MSSNKYTFIPLAANTPAVISANSLEKCLTSYAIV